MIALLLAALYASTARVSGVAIGEGKIWAATASGVEEYDLDGARLRLYTSEDGLDENQVLRIRHDGVLRVWTERSECSLAARGRFVCLPAPLVAPEPPSFARRSHGARETGRLLANGKELVATDGAGLWLDGRPITPRGQICGNHVEALAVFRGSLWAGTFDSGVCVLEGGSFRPVAAPFRMVNDLRATAEGLWVAAGEGLFFTRDGRRFRREARVLERGVNRLAGAGPRLFATTPVALYAIGNGRVRRWAHLARSTALQAVTVSGANVWLASEDAGVIRLRGGRFDAFDRASGLPSSWAVDVAPAPHGGVWAATLRDGAVRLDGNGTPRERLYPASWGLRLYDDGGRILFGTQQGLAGCALKLPDARVHALLRTRSGLYIGTEGGLWHEPAEDPCISLTSR